MATLATKYRPKTFEDVTEQSTVVEILSNMCKDKELSCRNFLLIGSAGCGKAQPMSSKVLTTKGYKCMKDIKAGDITFTSRGTPAQITETFDQGKLDVYKICLDDGSSVIVADSHINVIALQSANDKYIRYNCTTKELREAFSRRIDDIYIPAVYPIKLDIEIEEDIDTFLLATIRLYGSFNTRTVYFMNVLDNPNYETILNHFTEKSIPFSYVGDSSIKCNLNDLHLEDLKYVHHNLFTYQFNLDSTFNVTASLETRLSTFKNLINLIGYKVEHDNEISIDLPYSCTNDYNFADEFVQLCESLGYIISIESCNNASKIIQYSIRLNSTCDSSFDDCLYRKITDIQCAGQEYCRCLWIDDEDHTYLTEHCIPTHNTTLARIMGNTLNDNKGEIIEIDAASNGSTDAVRNIVQQAQAYPVGQKWKVFILDECFRGDTKISTPKGDVEIKDIEPGHVIYNMLGPTIVNKVYKVKVPKNRVCCVKTQEGYNSIYTTVEHLFLTSGGWVPANQLIQHDRVYQFNDIKPKFTQESIFGTQVDISGIINTIDYEVFARSTPHLEKLSDTDAGGWGSTGEFRFVSSQLTSSDAISEIAKKLAPDEFDDKFDTCEDDNYVWMYDLEIEGHPSYFANGVLVHNCHSFSNAAWQVLLKVLEEQPARTIFFLATTNPERIPATILSRVQTFQLSKISLHGIETRLKYVIGKENEEGRGITYTDDAINFLAKLAGGGMRDALTLLDKALAYSKDLTSENLEKALNLPSYDDYFELLSAYAKKDNTRIIKVINTAYNSGVNFVTWLENFHAFVMNIVKFIFLKDITATMIPVQYADKISKYNDKQALVCMKLAQQLVELNQEVRYTNFQQELALTYLCFPISGKGDSK